MAAVLSQKPVEPEPSTSPPGTYESEEFDAVYEDYSQPIYYLALRMLGDPAQAQDATHDVFLKAFRKLDQFKGKANIRTWLYRITINHCQNLLRSWQRRNIHGTDSTILDQTGTQSNNPLRVLEIKELGERIQKTLDQLPEEYSLLLLLVADEKLSYEEVGTLTDQTSDAVRGKLHRARKAFALHFNQSA